MDKYDVVIGLEVHIQLNTNTKIFCNCSTKFGNKPNTNVCPVCTAMPGVLPVLNKKVVDYAIKVGLGLNCSINKLSVFSRKQYFYPDLPKNYQISQYDKPICENGYITLSSGKKIGITRAHIEEDAGKLIHSGDESLVDYNRTGVPLIEIVSEPDISSPSESYDYLMKLKQIIKYLGVSDCNMEEGSLRCDANISIKPFGSEKFGTKTEIKNLNSFKAVEKSLEYEINRHIEVIEDGNKIIQETRLWDDKKGITASMRSKEEANDYRYFPEPDLRDLVLTDEWIDEIKNDMPLLPDERFQILLNDYDLSTYDAGVLISEKSLVEYFEEIVASVLNLDKNLDKKLISKQVSNWLTVELLGKLNKDNKKIEDNAISSKDIAKLIFLLNNNTISGKIGKVIFDEMYLTNKTPDEIIKEKNLVQITDSKEIEKVVIEVIDANPKSVLDYKSGKVKIIGFLVGQVMQKTKGKASPGIVNQILKEKLDAR